MLYHFILLCIFSIQYTIQHINCSEFGFKSIKKEILTVKSKAIYCYTPHPYRAHTRFHIWSYTNFFPVLPKSSCWGQIEKVLLNWIIFIRRSLYCFFNPSCYQLSTFQLTMRSTKTTTDFESGRFINICIGPYDIYYNYC